MVSVLVAAAACGDPATISSAAPNVTIEEPSDTLSFDQGDPVTFKGSATDPEDGPIPSGNLLWVSSLDSGLGTGSEITVNDLSPGGHEITLVARDSDGVRGSASINILIRASTADPVTPGTPRSD